jgi:transposase
MLPPKVSCVVQRFARARLSSSPKSWGCLKGDRSFAQVAHDFNLTVSAVRGWVKQAEIDAGTRFDRPDDRGNRGAVQVAPRELPAREDIEM